LTRLRVDFDRQVGPNVPEDYRAKILLYDDFCTWWRRLAEREGLQESWRRRFELGYDAYSHAVMERLERVMASGERSKPSSMIRDAA
jgi:hypothetical protein